MCQNEARKFTDSNKSKKQVPQHARTIRMLCLLFAASDRSGGVGRSDKEDCWRAQASHVKCGAVHRGSLFEA